LSRRPPVPLGNDGEDDLKFVCLQAGHIEELELRVAANVLHFLMSGLAEDGISLEQRGGDEALREQVAQSSIGVVCIRL